MDKTPIIFTSLTGLLGFILAEEHTWKIFERLGGWADSTRKTSGEYGRWGSRSYSLFVAVFVVAFTFWHWTIIREWFPENLPTQLDHLIIFFVLSSIMATPAIGMANLLLVWLAKLNLQN
jgi:hypothetical protein